MARLRRAMSFGAALALTTFVYAQTDLQPRVLWRLDRPGTLHLHLVNDDQTLALISSDAITWYRLARSTPIYWATALSLGIPTLEFLDIDNGWLLTQSYHLVNLNTRTVRATNLPAGSVQVSPANVAISASGRYVATYVSLAGGVLRVYDTTSGALLWSLPLPRQSANQNQLNSICIQFAHDESVVYATRTFNNTLQALAVELLSGTVRWQRTISAAADQSYRARLSPDGRYLAVLVAVASGTVETDLIVVDTQSGVPTWRTRVGTGLREAFAWRSATQIAVEGNLYDIAQQQLVQRLGLPAGVQRIAFSSDGNQLVAYYGEDIYWASLACAPFQAVAPAPRTLLSVSANGRWLAWVERESANAPIWLVVARSDTLEQTLRTQRPRRPLAVAVAGDGQRVLEMIAAAADRVTVHSIEVSTQQVLWSRDITTAFGETPSLFFAGDDSRAVVALRSSVVVLDAQTGAPTTFDFSAGAGATVSFAPARDEVYYRQFAAGGWQLRSLDIRTGETHLLLPLTTAAAPEGVAVSPDGRYGAFLIREGDPYRLVLMDLSTRTPVYTFAPDNLLYRGLTPSRTTLSLVADPVQPVFYLRSGDIVEVYGYNSPLPQQVHFLSYPPNFTGTGFAATQAGLLRYTATLVPTAQGGEPLVLYRLQPCAFLRLQFLPARGVAPTPDGRALYLGLTSPEAVCVAGIGSATPTLHRVFTQLPDQRSRFPHLRVAADWLLVGDFERLIVFERATMNLQQGLSAPPGLTYTSSANPFVVGRAGSASGFTNSRATLFDWQANQTLWSVSSGGELGVFENAAFSPRLRYVLLKGAANRVYDLTTRQVVRDFPNRTFDLPQPFSSDEEYLSSGNDILSVSTGQLVRRMPGAVLAVHGDGAFCSELVGGVRSITLRRVSTGALVARLSPPVPNSSDLEFALSEDGRRIFVNHSALVMTYRNPLLVPEGDVNDDNCVDNADLLEVLFNFGVSDTSPADLNGDGIVNNADLLIVLFNFGSGC